MLKRRKRKKISSTLIFIIATILLLLFVIKIFIKTETSEKVENSSGVTLSGNIETGIAELLPAEKAILNDLPLTGVDNVLVPEEGKIVKTSEEIIPTKNSKQRDISTITTGNKNNKNSDKFPVPLCNRIVTLYECIIQNAPIEHQPIMQESLKKATSQRTLLASPQLNEICQSISSDETFLLVKDHYVSSGFNCTF